MVYITLLFIPIAILLLLLKNLIVHEQARLQAQIQHLEDRIEANHADIEALANMYFYERKKHD